jgi:branched-chain amino acid transport system ATP-binding protein
MQGLTVEFGGVHALDNVGLQMETGQIVGVVGANGAGKTTLLNAIGALVPRRVSVLEVCGHDVRSIKGSAMVTVGIGRSFQSPRLLEARSVLDNLVLAGIAGRHGVLSWLTKLTATRRLVCELEARALELVQRFQVERHLHDAAGSIPYGAQKKIDIARALMTRPQLLLLDEPTSGLDPDDSVEVGNQLRDLLPNDCTGIVLVEHNLNLIRRTADTVVLLDAGRLIMAGATDEVMESVEFRASLQGTAGARRGPARSTPDNA